MTCRYPGLGLIARMLLFSTVLQALSGLPVSLAKPASEHHTENKLHVADRDFDVYGLPTRQLEGLLRQRQTLKVRAIISQIPRHPNDDDTRATWLAACLSAEGKDEESLAEFGKVKHPEKANSYALYWVARAYCQEQSFARAEELASLGIARGDCSECFEVRAACYESEKRYIDAAADYESLANCKKRYATDFHCKAALALLKANQPAKAMALIDKVYASEKGELSVTLLLAKGKCLESLGRYDEAIVFFSKAMKAPARKVPTEADFLRTSLLNERLKCFEKLGRKADAAADRAALEKISRGLSDDLLGK